MKRILVLGDSITFGHGCQDRQYYWDYDKQCYIGDPTTFTGPSAHCWAQHIQNELGYSVVNIARSGNNNTHLAWQCLQAVQENKEKFDHIIAAFSYDDRQDWEHPAHDTEEMVSASPLSPPPMWLKLNPKWGQALQMYCDELYNPLWGVKLTHMAINTVSNIARESGAGFNWSVPEFNQTESSELISQQLRNCQLPSMIKHFGLWHNGKMLTSAESKYCAPDGHPNELAHKEYFNAIIKHIV